MTLDDPLIADERDHDPPHKRPSSPARKQSIFTDYAHGGRYQLGSNFMLEVLHGKTIKVMMLTFYITIAIAFYLKIYSENVMETEDVCNPMGNCTEYYTANQTIPLEFEDDIICDRSCIKYVGVVPSLSVLNKFYFLAVDFGAYEDFGRQPPRKRMEFPLQFFGYSHIVSNEGGGSGSDVEVESGAVLPPSNFMQNRSEVQLLCKEGLECDVILFPEPIYQTNKPRRIQLVLLNAEMLDPLQPMSPTILIVYHYWLETILEITFRILATLLVLVLLIYYFVRLRVKQFITLHDPTKRWLIEQKVTVILLLCSILYLQPWKLYFMHKTSTQGLALDGEGFSWEDRILLFFDANLPFYFINFLRMYELVILACCLQKRPRMAFEKRGTVLIAIIVWFIVFLAQDFAHLGSDYESYYTSHSSGQIDQQLLSNSIVYTILIFLWVLMLLALIQKAASNLLRQQYWGTKSRQLSFRFFMVLYIWHVIYNMVTFMYCFYKFSSGRIVLDHLVCNQIVSGHTVGDAVSNICFVLILAFMFGPVKADPESQPPEAVARTWIRQKWTEPWMHYVNDNGNATQYFFFWEPERSSFNDAQEYISSQPVRSGMLHHAMQKLREYGTTITHKIVDQSFNFSERSGSKASQQSEEEADPLQDDSDDENESERVKPFFCLELAVDLLLLSWEVYGEEPGNDHSRESEGKMPIDCERHGYELLEVIHACADGKGKARDLFEKKLPAEVHPHPVSYRYVPSWSCDSCDSCDEQGKRTGMCFVCPVATCAVTRGGEPFVLCKDCASQLGKSGRVNDDSSPRNVNVQQPSQFDGELKVADLQAIICRNDDRIVIAFRGTDNMRNVQTDCQMFRDVVHEMISDKRWELLDFSSWMYRLKRLVGCGLPRCHRGFLRAFQVIGPEVLDRLKPILLSHKDHQVCCAGHSLGGALSMLMAYWVRRYLHRKPLVYTFGSPRVGNQTFQKIYDDSIPDTFRVVNQCDVVPHIPIAMNGMLFRHCGREVCIDKRGNLIIEPTFIEKFIGPTKHSRGISGMLQLRSRSLTDHLMLGYAKSLNKVSEYFKVLDCTIAFVYGKNSKPAYVWARRRWAEDGPPNRCILCKRECFADTKCGVSNNYHMECPEEEVDRSMTPGDRSAGFRKSVKINSPISLGNPLAPQLFVSENIHAVEAETATTTTGSTVTVKMDRLTQEPFPPIITSLQNRDTDLCDSPPPVIPAVEAPIKHNMSVDAGSPSNYVAGRVHSPCLVVGAGMPCSPAKTDLSDNDRPFLTSSCTSFIDSKKGELGNISDPTPSNQTTKSSVSFNKPSSYHITWGSIPPSKSLQQTNQNQQQSPYEAAQGALALARLWGSPSEDELL
eukprot:TRINITY_DN8021_c0_g1_i1.p1 TRINITY_DN8021_c0_g1~~TRINITY_DN8021_c0_g1_i1.p1  ORF type:complete len:1353 (+),score=158.37 TRINITY_DN8021_c0_g1_i1:77-4135(+)